MLGASPGSGRLRSTAACPSFDRWGLAGISIRPPALGPTLGAQGGLYTRVLADSDTRDARVIGCHIATVDAQVSPEARPTASPPSPTTPATTAGNEGRGATERSAQQREPLDLPCSRSHQANSAG